MEKDNLDSVMARLKKRGTPLDLVAWVHLDTLRTLYHRSEQARQYLVRKHK